jgi:large subunit ribosomal protein L6
MSKIGQKPIAVPEGVGVAQEGLKLAVKGPAGELSLSIPSPIEVVVEGDRVRVAPREDSRRARQLWGLTRTLIDNAVRGVKEPFRKELEFEGLGYRVEKRGRDLVFQLGFSHPIEYQAPEGVELEVVGKNKIAVSGVDKQLVGQTAAEIRALRPPEPYKGKGLRYVGEKIKRKSGKAVKAGVGLGGAGG